MNGDYHCWACQESFDACQCVGGPSCYDCEPTGEDCHCEAEIDAQGTPFFLEIGWWSPAGFSMNPAHYPDGVIRAFGPNGEEGRVEDGRWKLFDSLGNEVPSL